MAFTEKVLNIINNNEIPLIYGPTGIGKTHFVQKIVKKLLVSKNYERTFHLYSPLEPNEFTNISHSVNNNPNQIIVLDNIDEEETKNITLMKKFIKTIKKQTIIIAVCIHPYESNIKTFKDKCILCQMPELVQQKIINKAIRRNASKETLQIITSSNIQDYRLFLNIINNYSNCSYDTDTFNAIRNPFKAINYLLGTEKNNANLDDIIESNQFYYNNAIHANYTKISKNINSIEKISQHLSDLDFIGLEAYHVQRTLLAKTYVLNTNKKAKPIKFNFMKYIPQFKYITRLSIDINFYFIKLIKFFNSKDKLDKYQEDYLIDKTKYYKIDKDTFEKYLSIFEPKKLKLNINLKKILM
tara:strand:+ start:14098 stop:15165 length:1068 start_codon:yes stop_codon:yes gene_type:complete